MWLNSMQREETLPGLDMDGTGRESVLLFGADSQVLHGCRQLVS